MAQPLDGIKVLEMTVAIQGPAAGLYLADMGADVIKIEPPAGDSNRHHRGNEYKVPDSAPGSQFIAMNRGKRSLPIDVHHPLGQKALMNLLADADVFLSNYRADGLKRMGLGYPDVHAKHPQLIYATANGFGSKGPDADKAMLDGVAQARGGIVSMTGDPGDRPLLPGAPIADTAGAMQLALAIMTALFARERQGVGQQVHTSALGGQLWLQMWELQHRAITGTKLQPAGQFHDNMRGPYGLYKTADGGWIMFASCMVNEAWDALCTFGGKPEAIFLTGCATPGQRLGAHGPSLAEAEPIREMMAEMFSGKTTAQWCDFLYSQPEIIWERVRDHGDVLQDPQNLANGYLSELELPGIGRRQVVGQLIDFSETQPGPLRPAPALAENADQTLLEAGLTASEAQVLLDHTADLREQLIAQLVGDQ